MPRPEKFSKKPIATVLTPEDEARFAAECERLGITRSELAREMISGRLEDLVRQRLENDA